MQKASEVIGGEHKIRVIKDTEEAGFAFSCIDVLCPDGVNVPELIKWGMVDAAMGKAAASYLAEAFRMALEKRLDGVISSPINKAAFHLAGYHYADELEYLAELTKSPEPFAMGVINAVWSVTVTFHLPFKEIPHRIKKSTVFRYIRLMDENLKKIGFHCPRIAVAALNVHAGEGGLFGQEEIDEIRPAIEEARRLKMDVKGPLPADTVFVRATDGEFDGVVFMYHDQMNIARKLYGRRKGAAFYMGLPVVCGTTAHGTAFDIAGKGIADPGSMEEALRYTALLSS